MPKPEASGGLAAVAVLFAATLAAAVCMFACGVLTDMVRAVMAKGIHHVLSRNRLYSRLTRKLAEADGLFADR